jgi:hypothetical protein
LGLKANQLELVGVGAHEEMSQVSEVQVCVRVAETATHFTAGVKQLL